MMYRGLSLGSMLLLTACAGADGTFEDVGEADQALALAQLTEEALTVETALLDGSVDEEVTNRQGQWWLPRPLFNLLQRLGAEVDRECVTTRRWIDRDGDGLPADATSNVACTTEVAGTIVHAAGRVRVADLDDARHHAGYYIEFEDFVMSETIPGADLVRTTRLDGHATVTLGGPFLVGSVDRELEVTTSRRAQSDELQRVLTMVTRTHYLPAHDSLGDPFARGALDLVGHWRLQAGGHDAASFVWTEPPLYYDRSCATESRSGPGFVRGTLHTGGDDSSDGMNLVFTGCGNWSYDFEQ